ncbi:MAG: 4'-phosphopantetheinyl transferase superfamily protein [Chloroflexi bacterium]|nr:4'-phosphopantetheinyl transferase superfamily protein [Chloroflexota bacterium]
MIISELQWRLPPNGLKLEPNEVHIWRASLGVPEDQIQRLKTTLAEQELKRAEAFFFPRDAERFVVARGVLRDILGRYVGVDPSRLRFSSGSFTKPTLIEESSEWKLRFSLAHSHQLALYAVARDREVGVDVEYIRPDKADERLVEQLFSAGETARLRSLSEDARKQAFYCCWTRKEAYLKARGDGLSVALDRFEVSLTPGEGEVLLTTPGDPDEERRWSLRELFAGPGYAAALAVEGQSCELKCWQWQPQGRQPDG